MSNGHGRSTDGFGISREQSVQLIVKTCLENGVTDQRQIAYMLATAQHETRNFQAPEEDFGRSQARKLGYRGGEDYYGRGYVHLTHIDNYEKFDKLLGMNGQLVKNPDLAKDPEIAAKILVMGMREGMFTGKRLDRYIDEDSHDLYNARRTVNGVTSKAPWSIKAAKQCEQYAEAWEKEVPSIVDTVQQSGINLKPNPIATGVTTTNKYLQNIQKAEEVQAPLLSNPSYPGFALFKQATQGLEQLGPQAGFRNREELERVATALAAEARASGLQRIDHVVLSNGGANVFAVQGRLDDPAHQRIYLDKVQAIAQPLEQSRQQLQQQTVQQQQEQPTRGPVR